MFADKSFATISPRVDYPEYCNMIQQHKFMICPEGNAVDCHRNWEVLLLKRVPIMKRMTYLQECYKDYPILWVDDYADVNKTLLAENDDLFIRSRNLDINMLDLYCLFNRAVNRAKIPEVTLLMLADLDLPDAVYAINKSCEEIEWGAAKFLGSKKPEGLCDQVEYEETYPIQSINDFNFYCIYNLTNHVRTLALPSHSSRRVCSTSSSLG